MEALRKYKYSLEHKIALLGEEDPSVGWSKNNIGNAFKGLGKYDEALKWYQESLTTVTKHYGPEHPEVGHVHWNMGLCYQSKGEGDAYKRKVQEEECGWVGGPRVQEEE
jgi:tetratricopeptide (TPR) repeat protein